MSDDESIPHLIFHGQFGKKTMVKIFLGMLFGDQVYNTKQVKYIIFGSGNNANEEYFTESPFHIEIHPKGTNNDRHLVQDVINQYAQRSYYNIFKNKHNFKIIVIHNTHKMLSSVQFSLRRTIEKYSDTCRFILITNSVTKIIKPLLSRCKCIKLQYPEKHELIKYTLHIAGKENIKLSLDQLTYVINKIENIKDILWYIQLFRTFNLYVKKLEDLIYTYKKIGQTLNFNTYLVNIFTNKFLTEIKNANINVLFQFKNLNRFINEWGTKFYDIAKVKISNLVSTPDYDKYFSTCTKFIKKFNKNEFKKIKFKNDDKKFKNNDLVLDLHIFMMNFIKILNLFEIKLDSEIIIDKLIKMILTCSVDNFDEIRDIYFNMSITNYTGTDIIKNIVNRILLLPILSDEKKVKIVQLCSDVEYNMIIGRREIIQFDLLIIMIMDIIKN